MMYKLYPNCPITKTNSMIITPWIDSIDSEWYTQYKELHTGVDIQASEVYSFASGIVSQVGEQEDGLLCVTIQYNAQISLSYMHLIKVYVNPGETIYTSAFIGVADEFVHFEYLLTAQGTSNWPVRIGNVTYYKQDPEILFQGQLSTIDDKGV